MRLELAFTCLAASVWMSACSEEPTWSAITPSSAAQTPADLAALVPGDAIGFLKVSSLAALERKLHDLAREFGNEENQDAVELLSDWLAGRADAKQVDPSRPLGLAVSLGAELRTSFVAILPVRDAASFTASVVALPGLAAPRTQGDYVGLPLGGSYVAPAGASDLTADMLAGNVSVRLDLARLTEAQRVSIDQGLAIGLMLMKAQPVPETGFDMGAIHDAYGELLRGALDSVERLEFSARLAAPRLDVRAAFVARAGSAMDGMFGSEPIDMTSVAGKLDPTQSMSMLVGLDFERVWDRLSPWTERVFAAYPPAMAERMPSYVRAFEKALPYVGDSVACGLDFAGGGMNLTYFLTSNEPVRAVETYSETLRSLEGLAVGPLGTRTVGGMDLLGVNLSFDLRPMLDGYAPDVPDSSGSAELRERLERVYGGLDLDLELLALEGGCAALGGTVERSKEQRAAAVKRMQRTGAEVPELLSTALAEVNGKNACVVALFDVGTSLRELGDRVEGLGRAGGSGGSGAAPVVFFGAADGRRFSGGASLNLADLVAALAGE